MRRRVGRPGLALVAAAGLILAACTHPSASARLAAPGHRRLVYTPPRATPERGELVIPKGRHHTTAIILVHGGGGTIGDLREMRAWQLRYKQAGYVTFSVNYTLMRAATPSPVYPKPETNVKVAVQYVRRHAREWGVDPEHIVMHGASAGARLGGQVLVTPDNALFNTFARWPYTSDRINGFIGFYGYYDGWQLGLKQYYGGSRDSRDPAVRFRYALADSNSHAADATGPSLLIHGKKDVLPVAQSIRFADALKMAGKDVTLLIVAGANHGFDGPDQRKLTSEGERAADRTLRWLRDHFPDTG